jgi:hypothetical protein
MKEQLEAAVEMRVVPFEVDIELADHRVATGEVYTRMNTCCYVMPTPWEVAMIKAATSRHRPISLCGPIAHVVPLCHV